MAMKFGPEWMRKASVAEPGRGSPVPGANPQQPSQAPSAASSSATPVVNAWSNPSKQWNSGPPAGVGRGAGAAVAGAAAGAKPPLVPGDGGHTGWTGSALPGRGAGIPAHRPPLAGVKSKIPSFADAAAGGMNLAGTSTAATEPSPAATPATSASVGAIGSKPLGSGAAKSSETGSSNSPPTVHRYDRDFVLGRFDPTVQPPSDYEPVQGVTVDEVLQPLALIPLSDIEAKLISSGLINSDLNARRGGTNQTRDGDKGVIGDGHRAGYGGHRGRHNTQGNRRYDPGQRTMGDRHSFTSGRHRDFDGEARDQSKDHHNSHDESGPERVDDYREKAVESEGDEKAVRLLDDTAPAGPISQVRPVAPTLFGGKIGAEILSSSPGGAGLVGSSSAIDVDARFADMFNNFAITETPTTAGILGKSSFQDQPSILGQAFANGPGKDTTQLASPIFRAVGSGLGAGLPVATPVSNFLASTGIPRSSSTDLAPQPIGTTSLLRSSLSQENLLGSTPTSVAPGTPPGITAPFKPPISHWYYKDPTGAIQGTFTTEQMELWFKDNYFVDELMIRCGADGQFEPLSSLMAKYGRSSPFLGHDDAMAIAAKTPASRFRAEPLRTGSGIQDRIGGDLAGGAPFVPYSPFGAFDQPHASPIQTAGMMSSSFPGQGRFYNSNFVEQPPLRDAYGNPGVAFGSGWADSRQPGYGFSQLGGAPRPWAPALGSQIGLGNSGLGLNRLGVGHVGPGGSGIGAASPAIGTDSAGLSHFLTGIGASQLSDSINQHSPPSQETKAAESSGATSAAYTGQVSSLSLFGDSMAPAVPEPKSWLAVQSQTTQGDPKLVSSPTQPEADVALAGDGFSTTANVVEEPSEVPAVAVAAQDPVETPSKDAAQSLPPTSSVAIAKAAKKSAKAKVDSTNEAPTKPDEPPAPSQKSKKASKQESKAAVAAAIASQQPASNGQPSASAGTVWKTPSTPSLTQSKSLKEIQEAEEREREAKERERQRKAQAAVLAEAQSIAEMEAAMAVNSAAVASGSGVWGTSSKSTVKSKTMAEIMEEERRRTEAAAAAASAALAASASTTTSPTASVGKRHTESAAPSSGWVAVAAATPKGAPAATKPTQSALSKAQVPAVVASKPSEAWSVVGKSGNAVKPVVAPTPPAAPSTVKPAVVPRVVPAAASKTTAATRPASAAAPAAKRGPSGPSDALVQWCRQALKPLERSSASANVDEFIQILFMIPINESATTVSICDDTLGGLTAMDARKFAEEFLRRRRNDIENPGWTIAGSATKAGSSAGLPASAVIGPSSLNKFETANSFTVVSGKGGKKKKK